MKKWILMPLVLLHGALLAFGIRPPGMHNLMAVKNIVSAESYGFDTRNDGLTNYSAFQVAIDSAHDKTLMIGAGTFDITYTSILDCIVISDTIRIIGQGMGSTVIRSTNVRPTFEIKMITTTGDAVIILEDLSIQGPNNPYNLDSVNTWNTTGIAEIGYSYDNTLYMTRVRVGENLRHGLSQACCTYATDCEFMADENDVLAMGNDPDDIQVYTRCLFERAASKWYTGAAAGINFYCHPDRSLTLIGCRFSNKDRYSTYPGRYCMQFYSGSGAVNIDAERIIQGCVFDSTAKELLITYPQRPRTIISGNIFYTKVRVSEDATISNNIFMGPDSTGKSWSSGLTIDNKDYGYVTNTARRHQVVSGNLFKNAFLILNQYRDSDKWGGQTLITGNTFTAADSVLGRYQVYGTTEYTSQAQKDSIRFYILKDNTFVTDGKTMFGMFLQGRFLLDGNIFTCTGTPTQTYKLELLYHGTNVYFRNDNAKFYANDSTWSMANAFDGANIYTEGTIRAGEYRDYSSGFTTVDSEAPDTLTAANTVNIRLRYNKYFVNGTTEINQIDYLPAYPNASAYVGKLYLTFLSDSCTIGDSGNIVPKSTAKRGFPTTIELQRVRTTYGGAAGGYQQYDIFKWMEL